jgi:hypothetical protein
MIKHTDSMQASKILFGDSVDKDGYVNNYIDFINEGFELYPSYYQVTKNNDYITKYDTWIQDEKSYNSDISKKKIIMKPGQYLSQGEIINWENKKWLCTKIDQQETYYNKGFLQFCNYELKWININGEIVSSWCVIEDRESFMEGIEESKYVIVGDSYYLIILPRNSETLKIRRNDRFLISRNIDNPIGYKVTKVNDTYRYGLIILNVQEQGGELSVDDNATLMIADYYKKIISYNLSILNGSELSIDVAQNLQLNIRVDKTQNGIVSEVSPTPLISYVSSDENVASIDSSGYITFKSTGNVTITAMLTDDNTVYDSIDIEVIEIPQNNIIYTITGDSTVDDEIRLNSTMIFTGKKFINGIEDNDAEFDFSIIPGSTPISAYTYTLIDDVQISIKCNSYLYYVTLQMTDRSNGNITQKIIKLRGII